MLRHVGRHNPLLVVFLGICLGILLCCRDYMAVGLVFVLLALTVALNRLFFVLAGVLLGILAIHLSPEPLTLSAGEYVIEGRVAKADLIDGQLLLRRYSVDGTAARGLAMLRLGHVDDPILPGAYFRSRIEYTPFVRLNNFDEYDYGRYLRARKITLRAAAVGTYDVDCIQNGYTADFADFLRSYSRPEAELLRAILLGQRGGLTHQIRDSFAGLGISHLMAISGLHIGLVLLFGYGVVWGVLRMAPCLNQRYDLPQISKFLALWGVVLYVIIVGAAAPTLRAAIMAAVLVVGFWMKRHHSMLTPLALAGCIILIVWPWSIYDASFLLSFAAVLGIVIVLARLRGRPAAVRYAAVPLAAMAFTLPISAFMFGFVSAVGFLSNLLLVPLFSFVIMPLSLLAYLLWGVSELLAGWLIAVPLDLFGCIMLLSERWGRLYPVTNYGVIWVFATLLSMLLLILGSSSPLRNVSILFLVMFMSLKPALDSYSVRQQPLCFEFINVGQGECTLVSKGDFALLIDGGGRYGKFDAGRYIVARRLLQRGITQLDVVVLTHPDSHRSGGLPYILRNFAVAELWSSGLASWNADYIDVERVTKKKSIPIRNIVAGESYFENGIIIKALNPPWPIPDGVRGLDPNLHSICLWIGDAKMSGIFMADADGLGELNVAHLNQDIRADILKVANHGSEASCQSAFIQKVFPRYSVVTGRSAGLVDTVNSRLHEVGSQVLRLEETGAVKITANGNWLNIKLGASGADNIHDLHLAQCE